MVDMALMKPRGKRGVIDFEEVLNLEVDGLIDEPGLSQAVVD